jgi:type VI secretion system protein ImpH
MAASNWGTDSRLNESLYASACEFDFFQAVRLLRLASEGGQNGTQGGGGVRFRSQNSLAFPASAIAQLVRLEAKAAEMTVTFLGMSGPHGALPAAYTEIAIDRECLADRSFADFLDIFNHRLIELFFEAWKKHRFVIGYEQSRRANRSTVDDFTNYLFDLIGMGTDGLRGRMPIADLALLRYAGLLAQRPHSAEALRAMLSDYFGVPVAIEQFVGTWHALEPDEACSLGSGTANSRLGTGALAGDAVWTGQDLVGVAFGPLTAEQFHRFLPDGDDFEEAAALIRWFLGNALDFEIRAVLRREEVPSCRLGDDDAARLGWSAWLRTEPFWRHAADAVFRENEQVTLEA